jgi:hypothetical protein
MDEKQKDRLATIIAGLAATGHYTHLKQVDTGKKGFGNAIIWKDQPFIKSDFWDEDEKVPQYDIIEHALIILQELEKTEL